MAPVAAKGTGGGKAGLQTRCYCLLTSQHSAADRWPVAGQILLTTDCWPVANRILLTAGQWPHNDR
eukprot:1139140-Pelagomonas_calceolata.AAC.3